MLRLLLNLFRRPPIRMGRVDNSRIRTTRIRNAGFVSFIASQGCVGRQNTDRYDRRLRRQKAMKTLAFLTSAAGLAWVAVESARAIALF